MKIAGKIKKFFTDPRTRFNYLTKLGLTKHMSDEEFLKKKFKLELGYELNIENPQTFNEKMQWLKIHNRKPEYTIMVDKYLARDYVKEKIGDEYLIPLLGVWDNPDEIDFDKLPNQFVLKCNHNSGLGMCICRDKDKLDTAKVKANLRKGLKQDYYWRCREWPYKDVPRKIIAEKYMQCKGYESLPVYKIFCFNGKPEFIQAIQNDKQPNESIDYFDLEWNLLDLRQNYPNSAVPFKKPSKLSEMLQAAEKLAVGFAFIRIDLYLINDEIKFSEFTFYSDAGFAIFEPNDWDKRLGYMINLS